jgi:hypothetical protein
VVTKQSNSETIGATGIGGGKITSDGGKPITTYGICYATHINPTTSDAKTIQTNSIISLPFSFSSNITDLKLRINYFVRSYATNSSGTSYGNEITIYLPFANGVYYGGGRIFYVDNSKDHGLIIADSSINAPLPRDGNWGNRGYWGQGGYFAGVTDTSFGSGQKNTNSIIALSTAKYQSTPYNSYTAAGLCVASKYKGYNDWFLPSSGELLLASKNLNKSFDSWSSSEVDAYNAYRVNTKPYIALKCSANVTSTYYGSGGPNDPVSLIFPVRKF